MCIVVQRAADLADAHFQRAVSDEHTGPDGVEERLFGHQLASVRHQIHQDLKGFGSQGHWLLRAPQLRVGPIESKWSKMI